MIEQMMCIGTQKKTNIARLTIDKLLVSPEWCNGTTETLLFHRLKTFH